MNGNLYTEELIARYPALSVVTGEIKAVYDLLHECFAAGGKLLVAGNGGSCADAEHIAGELMKGFVLGRHLAKDEKSALTRAHARGSEIAAKLQRGLPTIALNAGGALGTAFSNDVCGGADHVFAQQVFVLGREGDIFLGISTSGNSANIVNAAIAAKARGMRVAALTGANGGELATIADAAVKAPATECYKVQEYHLPIYHCLCLMLESAFFGEKEE